MFENISLQVNAERKIFYMKLKSRFEYAIDKAVPGEQYITTHRNFIYSCFDLYSVCKLGNLISSS